MPLLSLKVGIAKVSLMGKIPLYPMKQNKIMHVIGKTFFNGHLDYFFRSNYTVSQGLSHGSDGKEAACSAGDPSSIPGSGRSPGEGNGNPVQYPCLENP